MMEGIEDVKTFLQNTQEIMIWEVNGFEQYWDDSAHEEFKQLLISEFGPWLVRPGELAWKTSLNSIWDQEGLAPGQGRIIITYNTRQTDPQYFFAEAHERWGNKNDPEELYEYINEEVTKCLQNLPFVYFIPGFNCQRKSKLPTLETQLSTDS